MGELVRGPVRETELESPCPSCGDALLLRALTLNLPFFGDALQTTVLCRRCGFRHADILLTTQGAPVHAELRVQGPPDLSARIVRSSAGTIRVPELGAAIEPGPAAEAFVSNVEGILHRIRGILDFAARAADTERARRNARDRLRDVDRMVDGRQPFLLVLEDPTGNSAILHDRATQRPLTPAEVRRLRPGAYTLDAEQVKTAFRERP